MTSHTGPQIITIHILPNISKIKGNHTMKFGQIIEYNMRNVFHTQNYKKSYTKCGEDISHRPFYKKSKFSIFLD